MSGAMMMLMTPAVIAAGGGATFSDDFESYPAAGPRPSSWTSRWTDTAYSTESGGSGRVLRNTQGFGQRSAISMNSVDGEATRDYFDILCKIKLGTVTAGVTGGGAVARGAGSIGAETGYVATTFGDALRLVHYAAGTANTLNTSASKGLVANTWYWIRFKIDNNGAGPMRARIWADGAGEPGTWDVTATAGTDVAAGWAGLFAFSAATYECDYFSIGTNGTAAP